jgi:hypothetical protein
VFKRVNFFEGQIRTLADYWDQVGHKVDKHKHHHRAFHRFGVVPGRAGELRVRQRRVPEMAVEVRPGLAIDPDGADILLREVELKRLSTVGMAMPCTLHLVLRYREETTDFRRISIPGFPECEGKTRIEEGYALDWTLATPDVEREVELCRILFQDNISAVRDAQDPNDPQAGEIDLRFVPKAGVCGGTIPGISWEELRHQLLQAIRTYTHLARSRGLTSAGGAAAACATMAVFNEAQVMDKASMMQALRIVQSLQVSLVQEAQEYEPALARRPKFRRYAEESLSAGDIMATFATLPTTEQVEAAQLAVGGLMGAEGVLHDLVQPPRLIVSGRAAEEMVPGTGIRVLDGTEWEKLKIESRMAPRTVLVEGLEWQLVDELNLLDPESERDHRFVIREAQDFWRNQVTLKYPDGAPIYDMGISHQGGYSEWEVKNLTPGLPLVIVRRMDYGRGDYWCRIWVSDVEAGEVPCHGQDTRYRWRNWPFYIHGAFVRHAVVRVRQAVETANRDVNYFRLWFYQPI